MAFVRIIHIIIFAFATGYKSFNSNVTEDYTPSLVYVLILCKLATTPRTFLYAHCAV